jgi:hypothetical protein
MQPKEGRIIRAHRPLFGPFLGQLCATCGGLYHVAFPTLPRLSSSSSLPSEDAGWLTWRQSRPEVPVRRCPKQISTFTFAELAREVWRRSLSLSRACRMHPLLFFLVAHKAASTISSGPAGQPSSLSGADAIDQTAGAPFPPFVIPVVPAQGHGNTRCSLQLPSSNPAPIGGGISTTRLSSPSHPRFRERLPRI